MNAFLRILHSFIVTINVGLVILLIMCGYAYKVKPEALFFVPFLGYAFPFLALINLFFIVYWVARLKFWVLISLFGALVTYGSYRAWFPINFNQDPLTDKTIKILSYNVMYFSYDLDLKSGQTHPILTYIEKTDADFVCLQEVGPVFMNEGIHSDAARKALRKYPYVFSGAQENRYSVIFLSKYPVLHFERVQYKSMSNSSFYYDVKVGKDTIRIINNHLESNKLNRDEKNKYLDLLKKRESNQLTEVAEVLGNKVGNASVIRARQADAIAELVRTSPYRVILCGDFNDVPGSYTYRTVRKGLMDSWIENGNGWGNTFHENFFLFRIDYIMHSAGIQSFRTKVEKVKYSDHYPILANLQIQ